MVLQADLRKPILELYNWHRSISSTKNNTVFTYNRSLLTDFLELKVSNLKFFLNMNGNIFSGQELEVQERTSLAKGLQKQARLEQINNLQKICLLDGLSFS